MTKHELLQWKSYLDMYGFLSDNFGPFSKIYNMTTENLLEFVNSVDCCDKDVLTVVGSGDQAMNVILNGARNITCFDINPVAYCQLKLKKEAIKALSFDEFCRFFYIKNSNEDDYTFFDKRIFDKFADKLDSDTYQVFNYAYDYSKGNTKFIARDIYFYFNYALDTMKNMSNYLNPKSYDKLADILNSDDVNINFIETDFKDLKKKIGNNKYDLMIFSNISDYIHLMYDNDPIEGFHDDIMSLTDNLNLLGIMQVGYIYSSAFFTQNSIGAKLIDDFGNKKRREKVFTTDMFYEKMVNAYDNYFNTDADKIIIYKKLK